MSDVNLDRQIEAFFGTFAAASDELDVDRLAELFAETFLAADPAGARAVSREAFVHALPRRAELFAAAGITRVVLADLDRRALDEAYVLVRTVWHAESIAAPTPIELSSTFILRRDEDGMRSSSTSTTKTSHASSLAQRRRAAPRIAASSRYAGGPIRDQRPTDRERTRNPKRRPAEENPGAPSPLR
jgi:ketosteroid isomerase-like protein